MTAHPPIQRRDMAPRTARRGLRKTARCETRPPFETIALVLQGGGALGSYQAGVYDGLAEANLHPDWVAGISIGSINAAIIAGNPPERRADRLRDFWQQITTDYCSLLPFGGDVLESEGDFARAATNQASAFSALLLGAPGFFEPRMPPPWLQPSGSMGATSFFDTAKLKATIESLVDFDRLNSGEMRVSLGAVNVRSGNFVYFDTATHVIRPEHVMASGALPPGLPAIEIDGEHYWDGGLVSNTPLSWIVDDIPRDTLVFQVDLWSSRGKFPRSLADTFTREKEIRYSSRTRTVTDRFRHAQRMRNALACLLDNLPENLKSGPEMDLLQAEANRKVYNIIHLIYRSRVYEGDSKDYEFSRRSMEERWRAGYNDTLRTLRHPEVLERPQGLESVFTFDLAVDGRE